MMGSVTAGEDYDIYGSNQYGNIGTTILISGGTLDHQYFSVPSASQYRYLDVACGSGGGSLANVLLMQVAFECSVTPTTVPTGVPHPTLVSRRLRG
jgi:hypothetical protein